MSVKRRQQSLQSSRSTEFDSTRWSVVLSAGQRGSPQALATLCETYWYPLYAYVRRRVKRVQDAQDLTQAFFARLLEKDLLQVADPQRGRFRAFLLTSLKNFLANEWDKLRAQKRGGGKNLLSLDFDSGESRYGLEAVDNETPEAIYDRQWAMVLLELVLQRLRDEMTAEGKEKLFGSLQPYVTGKPKAGTYAELAEQLQMASGAIKVAVHRLRKRYRQILKEEISQTLEDPSDVDEEIQDLFATVTR